MCSSGDKGGTGLEGIGLHAMQLRQIQGFYIQAFDGAGEIGLNLCFYTLWIKLAIAPDFGGNKTFGRAGFDVVADALLA